MSTTATPNKIVNHVDTEALGQTIEAIRKDPSIARFKFRATNKLVAGSLNQSTVKEFYGAGQEHRTGGKAKSFVMENSEAPVLLGKDEAPNPVEYLLQSMLGCMTTSTTYHAAARGIEIESIRSEIEGDLDLQGFLGLDPDVRPGFQEIRATLRIKSKGNASELRELFQRSPVVDTLRRPVPVKVNVVIED